MSIAELGLPYIIWYWLKGRLRGNRRSKQDGTLQWLLHFYCKVVLNTPNFSLMGDQCLLAGKRFPQYPTVKLFRSIKYSGVWRWFQLVIRLSIGKTEMGIIIFWLACRLEVLWGYADFYGVFFQIQSIRFEGVFIRIFCMKPNLDTISSHIGLYYHLCKEEGAYTSLVIVYWLSAIIQAREPLQCLIAHIGKWMKGAHCSLT